MKRIATYEIISFEDLNETVKFVKDGLNNGWQPYGELKVIRNENDEIQYIQAMVSYIEDENF